MSRDLINQIVMNPSILDNEAEWVVTKMKLAIEQIDPVQCIEKFVCIGKKVAQIRTSLY